MNKSRVAMVMMAGILTLGVFSFAGCQPDEPELDISLDDILGEYNQDDYVYEGEPCTITMAHWDSAGPMEEATTELVVEAFEKRYPTINVELDIISDYANTYAHTIAAGDVHDGRQPDEALPERSDFRRGGLYEGQRQGSVYPSAGGGRG